MIIEEAKNNVITIGETEQNKVSIDINNINFITTLLSSNLYSNPEQSFLREIVSNAWDSHVEAGNTDKPVIITIEENKTAIRDYGVGLSPERFKDIYLNIGSSTKRGDNTQIGGFGIGRFAALAVSNVVSITSYYNGMEYSYLMLKSGNSVNIDLISTKPTQEPNGVEVSVNKCIHSIEYYKPLVFFPNIYINTAYEVKKINNVKIKKFNHFSIHSYINGDSYYGEKSPRLRLGNVVYPLDPYASKCDDIIKPYFNTIKNLYLNFEIGDLEITPNRENLIYSKKTIEAIQNKCKLAIAEILDCIANQITKDNDDNIKTYINKLYGNTDVSIDDSLESNIWLYSAPVAIRNVVNGNLKYKNQKFNIDVDKARHLHYILDLNHYKSICFIKDGNIQNITERGYKNKAILSFDYNIIVLKNCTSCTSKMKSYISEKIIKDDTNKYLLLYDVLESEFLTYINDGVHRCLEDANLKYLVKELYASIYNSAIIIDFKDNKDYEQYKKDTRADKNTIITKSYTIKTSRLINDDYVITSDGFVNNMQSLLKEISCYKGGIIITNTRDEKSSIYSSLVKMKKIKAVIYMPKELLGKLPEITNRIYLEDLLKENSELIKLVNSFNLLPRLDLYSVHKYLNYCRDDIHKAYKYYEEMLNKYNCMNYELTQFIINYAKNKGYTTIDTKIQNAINVLDKFKTEINMFETKYQSNTPLRTDAILCYLLIKSKTFPIKYETYKHQCLNNPIIKLIKS